MLSYLLAIFRLLFFLATMVVGILICILSALFGGKVLERNMTIRKAWIQLGVWILGFRIECEGEIPTGHHLFVSNHRSFADPVAVLKHVFALPLAKAEVDGYPLIGYGARITGILYVKRNDLQSRRSARRAIVETLQEGRSVLVYPEGTTTIYPRVAPFKRGSFQVAAELDMGIVPIAIEYEDPADHWTDTSLWVHYVRQFGKLYSRCRIGFGPVLRGNDAVVLKESAETWINRELERYRAQFDEES